MTKRTWMLGGAAIVVLGLAGAGAWCALEPAEGAAEGSEGAVAVATDKFDGAGPALRLLGTRGLVVSGAYDARYAFALGTAGGRDAVTLKVDGVLEVAEPMTLNGVTWLGARLVAPRVTPGERAARVLDLAADASELERPFVARLEPDGRVTEVRFDAPLSVAARATLAAFLHGAQLVGPTSVDAATWEAAEQDATGAYRARYGREADGTVVKQWTTPPDRVGQDGETTTRFTLAAGRIERVGLAQRGHAAAGGSLLASARTPLSLDVSLVRRGPSVGTWAAALDPSALSPFSAAKAATRRRETEPARPFAQVMADVRARAASLDAGGRTNLRNELTRAIAVSPEAVTAADAALREGTLDRPAETVTIAALVGARTPEAQAAASGLVKDLSLGEPLRVRVLQSLAYMSSPDPVVIGTLLDLMSATPSPSYAAAAATTLGASAAYLAEKDPKAAEIAFGALVAHAKDALSTTQTSAVSVAARVPAGIRIAWLNALGNTGDPSGLPLILAGLDDRNEAVRGSAALALRRQAPQSCIDAMIKAMATDRSPHVRENVVDAARDMGPAVTGGLVEKALRYDLSEHVRLAAAYAFAVWSAEAPWLRPILADAAKHEKNPRVIEALMNYLQHGRIPGTPGVQKVKMGAHP